MEIHLNGEIRSVSAPADMPLLWVLREHLNLTGAKYGCGHGVCGGCMVSIDGAQAHACQTTLADVTGKKVVTIEGITEYRFKNGLRFLSYPDPSSPSVTVNADDEIGPIFIQYGLPKPKLVMHAHTGLTYMLTLVNSDLLVMLAHMWTKFPLWDQLFQTIEVKEDLPIRSICIVKRRGLPLTSAAEYFCDIFRRVAGYLETPPVGSRGR